MIVLTRASSALALAFLVLDYGSAAAVPHRAKKYEARQCEPVALLLNNGDRRFQAGSHLCRGDRLQPKDGAKVKVACRTTARIMWMKSGEVSAQCGQYSEQQPHRCTETSRVFCPMRKEPVEGNKPTLLVPYSNAILNIRPKLSWYPVPGATSYAVHLSGEGLNWTKTVSGTTLPYPKSQKAMSYSSAYQVNVVAQKGDSPVANSTSVLIVSSKSEAHQVKSTIEQIQSFGLPQDEAALDSDAVYMSSNLLTDALATLEARVKAGSSNPTLYRVLGDRYLEAGLPDKAKQRYSKATALAIATDNAEELSKAQKGLERTEQLYSQVPTRTKTDNKNKD